MRIETRPVGPEDEVTWRNLWRAYLLFYQTDLPEEIYRTTFGRLIDPAARDYHGLLAVIEGQPVGLAHYIFHRHGWELEDVYYLQDLYVTPETRGNGMGRTLIEAVYAAADAAGRPNVYWLTETTNTTARRLYDRIGRSTAFMKYRR